MVKRHYDQSNLKKETFIWGFVYGFYGLVHSPWRRVWLDLMWTLETSSCQWHTFANKATPTPTRPQLLIFPKYFHCLVTKHLIIRASRGHSHSNHHTTHLSTSHFTDLYNFDSVPVFCFTAGSILLLKIAFDDFSYCC